jgi:hypothetical protein
MVLFASLRKSTSSNNQFLQSRIQPSRLRTPIRTILGVSLLTLLNAGVGVSSAGAANSDGKFCATVVRLIDEGRFKINIVPTDTTKVGIAKIDRFRTVLNLIGKSAKPDIKSTVILVVSDLVRMRADLVNVSKYPKQQAAYVEAFQTHAAGMNADMLTLNEQLSERCGSDAPVGSQPAAGATTPALPTPDVIAAPAIAPSDGSRTASTGGYTITVNSILRNANAEVKRIVDVGVFNLYSPAPAGKQYVIVDVSVSWTGPGDLSPSATLGGFLSPKSVTGSDTPWVVLSDSVLVQSPFVPPSSLQVPKGAPQAYRWLLTIDSDKIDQARYLVFSDLDVRKAVSVALP